MLDWAETLWDGWAMSGCCQGLLRGTLSTCSSRAFSLSLFCCRYEGDYLITHDLGNSFIRVPTRFSWRQVSLGTRVTRLRVSPA